jgi:Leucine-rich repeat (LRR) protein
MSHRLFYFVLIPALLSLSACQGYDFTVNDKVVYAPQPLFSDFTAPDPGLESCLKQAINDGVITQADQLTSLDCSFAGIESLQGLSQFTGLVTLRLSANKVRNLVEIGKLVTLEELYLDDNQIVDPVPLYQLPVLRHVDLSGNATLQCPGAGSFLRVATVLLPSQCQKQPAG